MDEGTEAVLPSIDAKPGADRLGTHEFEWLELRGHTASDLVLVDRTRSVVFAGGLVFSHRVPTTPHAQVAPWRANLQALEARPEKLLVPSHGVVDDGAAAIALTQRYLAWLDGAFRDAAEPGLEMNDVLRMPVPDEFRRWAVHRRWQSARCPSGS